MINYLLLVNNFVTLQVWYIKKHCWFNTWLLARLIFIRAQV